MILENASKIFICGDYNEIFEKIKPIHFSHSYWQPLTNAKYATYLLSPATILKMASVGKGDICLLCFHSQHQFFNDFQVYRKVEKYLQIKMSYSPIGICSNCHNSIEVFHEFFEKVHAAQKKFKENIGGVNEILVSNHQQEEKYKKSDSEREKQEVSAIYLGNVQESNTENFKESFGKIDESKITSFKNKNNIQNSKLKTKSSEIEKKMLEFYNIKCEKCTEGNFTSFKMLSNHYWVVHNTQGYIKCCKRNIRVNDKYYLRSHMFKHLQPDTCRCMVCGKELSSTATLKHHMILHKPLEERPFQCSECSKKFCCKNDLKNHEKSIHLPENEKVDHICDACGKVFQKIANLRYHYSTFHLQERKYICEICAKCFTTQSGLKTHINAAHTSLSPIQCQICNKWLKTKDTFQKHWQLHQNNTYPCTQCDKVCNSSASLRSHLVKHSEERPYSCTVCRKSFKTKTHLKNHSAQHLGGMHFKCPFCPKFFVNMSNFYTHRRKMHSNEKSRSLGNKSGASEDFYHKIANPKANARNNKNVEVNIT